MRRDRWRSLLVLVAAAALVWAMPLAGLLFAGRPVAPYLEFPPRTEAVAHAPFSWLAFALVAAPSLAAFGLLGWAIRLGGRAAAPAGPLRWWGWLGIALLAAGWISAWSEGLLPRELRRHTFGVIWLGYILAINAVTLRRTGACPLVDRRRWFLALFPLSAAFWWLFEYLNQFTDNWYYVGIGTPGRGAYIIQGTISFATVLPAIESTRAWLASHVTFRPLPPLRLPESSAWIVLGAGAAVLAGIGHWPEILYPALWVGPLSIVCALQFLVLRTTPLAPLARGDWRPVLEPAAAALLCGLLWELWNYGSQAKWIYSIPSVQRFHLFEMPLLGYAGYLPFGVLCVVLGDIAARLVQRGRPG